MNSLCGIDEAGRGPIAGDLVVAGCILSSPIIGLNDSKKLSQKQRELLYDKIIQNSSYHIVTFCAADIDEKGISLCIKSALFEIMQALPSKNYLFDGNSAFGVKGLQTMIKADTKVPEVSAASILAKVTHDKNIIEDAKKYPLYEFEKHKGYGTARHVELIKKHGYCAIHRRSYKLKALESAPPTLF